MTYRSLLSIVPNFMSKEGHEQKEHSFVSVKHVYVKCDKIAW
jgi:hypothetical protein